MDITATALSAFSLMLFFGGTFLCAVYMPVVLRHSRQRDFSEAFWLALAIALSWGGVSINRLYVITLLEGPHLGWDTEWLRFHWFQGLTLGPAVIGMLLFLRVATYTHFGEYLWIGLTALIIVLSLTLSSAPQMLIACF